MTVEGSIRVAIADDDSDVVRLHSRYLADQPGFVLVGTAGTGAGAAELAARVDVDLLLLDMNLPDFSGIEVLHRLRMAREWDVDVLVISSARDVFTVRQALSAHVVGYLVKPFTRDAFTQRMKQYRDTRIERAEAVAGPLGQGEIDALATGSVRTVGEGGTQAGGLLAGALPKGLSASTMSIVVDALDPVHPATVRDVSAHSGASRATVRRYLDHLVRIGAADVSHRFGARGRPEVLYRRAAG